MLYLVATPIGNLEDITLRALRVLRQAAIIAAEDTRTARKLLTHFDIHTPVVSFHEYSARGRLAALLERAEAEDVAVVSEAGMPGISDPGYELVVAAVARGIAVVPIPGATAMAAALAASGLPTSSFLFLGFLPARASARRKALQAVASAPHTLIVYESPHRLLDSLRDIAAVLGERRLAVARELTKLHEELWRGSVSGAIEHFLEQGVRGEFTLVIAGAPAGALERWTEETVREALAACRSEGLGPRAAAAKVAAEAGWPARAVYRLGIEPKGLGDL